MLRLLLGGVCCECSLFIHEMRSESFLYSHKTNKAAARLLCFPREPGSQTETSLDTFHQKFELIRQIIKFALSLHRRDSLGCQGANTQQQAACLPGDSKKILLLNAKNNLCLNI